MSAGGYITKGNFVVAAGGYSAGSTHTKAS